MTIQSTSPARAFFPPDNFVECLRRLAADRLEDTAIVVAEERGGELVELTLTYRVFDQRVRALAALLQCRFDKGQAPAHARSLS